MPELIDKSASLSSDFLAECAPMPAPQTVLMCPPTYFDVVDVKNPHMEGQIGAVNAEMARRQWDALVEAFERCGMRIERIEPLEGCEDMVFCANQTFVGLDDAGGRLCVLSQMLHESRQREVPAFAEWFEAHGYDVQHLPGEDIFEGGGDAIWHPGRGLIWGGYGFRTRPAAYEAISDFFGVPVVRLRLRDERFYHLDTCLCALDEQTAMIVEPAFDDEGIAMIRSLFARVLSCDPDEAAQALACNATALPGKQVIIQKGCVRAVAMLRDHGYQVHEVDTSEFLKSGGSVFCMKMFLF